MGYWRLWVISFTVFNNMRPKDADIEDSQNCVKSWRYGRTRSQTPTHSLTEIVPSPSRRLKPNSSVKRIAI